eukprot:TRINITY_DN4685_c0_g1_i1.p1 TRINITY_DN4685_c0_g1~~TRINITY_DN4685_c0_g1_i1.p1  ORF type:complete len:1066 (-),score=107.12 TRINITY_DN4685_c0_g1_i1:49-3246(-)
MNYPVTTVLTLCFPLLQSLTAMAAAGSEELDAFECPPVEELDAFECPKESLSEELITNPGFVGSDAQGSWSEYAWEQGAATFSFGSRGTRVAIDKLSPQQMMYDAGLNNRIHIETNASAQYELCVQAAASMEGKQLRFAVDSGSPSFKVPGELPRQVMTMKSSQLSTSCFRFVLEATQTRFSGRVALEMGDTLGRVSICQVSLRRCKQSRDSVSSDSSWISPACPPVEELDAFECPKESLSEELITNPGFVGSDAQGSWSEYAWEQGAATFSFGSRGTRVAIDKLSPQQMMYDAGLNNRIHIETNASAQYELCVQAAASMEGKQLRFAVDSGSPSFKVPGELPRQVMTMKSSQLSTSCFRFVLEATQTRFSGRVALEMGDTLGRVSICQVSLRRCKQQVSVEGGLDPVRRCYLASLEQGSNGCTRMAVLEGAGFEMNKHCQETDGKRACLKQLRLAGGNTFMYSPGRCEIWDCPSRSALLNSASGVTDMHVYSKLCEYQESSAGRHGEERRTPVFVKLWEWNYADVARECEEFLGPNGFDAVQVSPVMEHVLSGSWWAKYQPVSFLLNSRSGTAEDLQHMVATCRSNGVEVIVDVVLNHIARECKEGEGTQYLLPCRGWAGSRYGSRRLESSYPNEFHHYDSDMLVNCGVDEGFKCPNGTPPGDCTHCDLFGLPDWDTSAATVREKLSRHLQELHSMGITMLRLDAASYISSKELSLILNQMPWDFVFQEWWEGTPAPSRTHYVGNYRDIFFGRRINKGLVLDDVEKLPELLKIENGLYGLPSHQALYPLTFHDQRSARYDPGTPTYKGGLEFHQQQKFLLANPHGHLVRLWGGFGWSDLEDGPPGCRHFDKFCRVVPVFYESGMSRCMPTPVTTPVSVHDVDSSRWVCEHRWEGVAGLILFRKFCQGQNVTQVWDESVSQGNLAWRTGDSCFAALQRRMPRKDATSGKWILDGLETGLPEGRYCDLASLVTRKGWDGGKCPREIRLGPGGVVVEGSVPEGDLVAIHAGFTLPQWSTRSQVTSHWADKCESVTSGQRKLKSSLTLSVAAMLAMMSVSFSFAHRSF